MGGKTIVRDLTSGSVAGQLLWFGMPLFFSGLLQTTYNMVDMMVVGHYIGKNGLSAVSVAGEVLNFLTFVAMGLSNAGQIILAQYVGRQAQGRHWKDHRNPLFCPPALQCGADGAVHSVERTHPGLAQYAAGDLGRGLGLPDSLLRRTHFYLRLQSAQRHFARLGEIQSIRSYLSPLPRCVTWCWISSLSQDCTWA